MIQSLLTADTYLHIYLTLKFLSAPISPVAREREFKSALLLANCTRTRLLSNSLRKFEGSWLYNSINLKRSDRNINQQIIQVTNEEEEEQIVKMAVRSIKLP